MDKTKLIIKKRTNGLKRWLDYLGPLYNCMELGELTRSLLRQDIDKLTEEYQRLNSWLEEENFSSILLSFKNEEEYLDLVERSKKALNRKQ